MITEIARAWAFQPGIITITSTDNLTDCLAQGYITSQQEIINTINKGGFQFSFGDAVLLSASDTSGLFKFNGTDFSTLIPVGSASGLISETTVVNGGSNSIPIPDGTIYIHFEMGGAGGGGGGAINGVGTSIFAAGSGGGAGGYSRGYISNVTSSVITGDLNYTIGAGGSGGVGGANGASGGNSIIQVPSASFTVTGAGGSGGIGSTGIDPTSFAFIPGGTGGGASGTFTVPGGTGFAGQIMSGTVCSGAGGISAVGPGGAQVVASGNGRPGGGCGSGGSGAARNSIGTSTGGQGFAGFMIVSFYGYIIAS